MKRLTGLLNPHSLDCRLAVLETDLKITPYSASIHFLPYLSQIQKLRRILNESKLGY